MKNLGIPSKLNTRNWQRRSSIEQLRDKEWLSKKYEQEGWSIREIARKLGTTPGNIGSSLYHANIKTRSVSDGLRARFPNGRWGNAAGHWKGGRHNIGEYIYLYTPEHPRATKQGYMMEHILIAEKKIGRYLNPGEIVHHIDGDKSNNSPDNLMVTTVGEHRRIHEHAVREVARLKKELEKYQSKC